MQPRLSFGSWAFSFGPFESAPWSFDRLCSYAAEAGYDGVEINGFRPHPYFRDYTGADDFRELVALRDDLGLEYSGYAPDFHDVPSGGRRPGDLPRDVRGGGPLLRPPEHLDPPGGHGQPAVDLPQAEYEERFARLARTLNAAAELAAKLLRSPRLGVRTGLSGSTCLSEVVRLLEAVAHPNFKILFDTSHAYTGAVAGARQGDDPELLAGGVAEYAELVEPYLGHLHLIDSDGCLHDDETSAHLPFGTGQIDFPSASYQALQPVAGARLPWWTVDFCFCPTTERDGRTAVPDRPFSSSMAAVLRRTESTFRAWRSAAVHHKRARALSTNGVEIAYSRNAAEGEPLVLIMGLGADRQRVGASIVAALHGGASPASPSTTAARATSHRTRRTVFSTAADGRRLRRTDHVRSNLGAASASSASPWAARSPSSSRLRHPELVCRSSCSSPPWAAVDGYARAMSSRQLHVARGALPLDEAFAADAAAA